MRIHRYLAAEQVKLDLEIERPEIPPEGMHPGRLHELYVEAVVGPLVDLLGASGRVGSLKKLKLDLINREKRASTALGRGVAFPHVRTPHAKELVMALGRLTEPIPFTESAAAALLPPAPGTRRPEPGELDEPVRLFFVMAAPPYDDKLYLRIYRQVAHALLDETRFRLLMTEENPHLIIKALAEAF